MGENSNKRNKIDSFISIGDNEEWQTILEITKNEIVQEITIFCYIATSIIFYSQIKKCIWALMFYNN